MVEIDNNRASEVRERYLQEIRRLLIGPGSENITTNLESEIISEAPTLRYLTGILYSKKDSVVENKDLDKENEELNQENDPEEQPTFIDNSFKPSTIGISFYCTSDSGMVPVVIDTAYYSPIKDVALSLPEERYKFLLRALEKLDVSVLEFDNENYRVGLKNVDDLNSRDESIKTLIDQVQDKDAKEYIKKLRFVNYPKSKNGNCFKRHGFKKQLEISVDNLGSQQVIISLEENINIKLNIIVENVLENSRIKSVTLVLENLSDKNLFQSKISVNANKKVSFFSAEEVQKRKFRQNNNSEEIKEHLMYRNKKTFAFGRGVAAVWDTNLDKPFKIETECIPTYEMMPMSFSISNLDSNVLRPQSYINNNKVKQIEYLKSFVAEYDSWILKTKQKICELDQIFKECASENLRICHECSGRIKKTIDLIDTDDKALKTFRLANETILLQRVKSRLTKEQCFDTHDYKQVDFAWRPFQLAFILLTFESLINKNSAERDVVDLLWVSTGGGKTEAYLFAIAATIIYGRLSSKASKFGTTVIMRYTLRLLTTQQFSRAAAMICALEYIRKNRQDLGEEVISLGLWIGNKSTPSSRKEAIKILTEMGNEDNLESALAKNQFQLLECPWCHEKYSIIPENNRFGTNGWGYKALRSKKGQFDMRCLTNDCPFSKGLPVYVVDETIYKNKPTLLFSTVDKFAQVPLRAEAGNLFGSFMEDITRPELVIQDELHLISGPLGSIVGLYESGFDYILQSSESNPKYIASTATIKNSAEQIKNLFDRRVFQFPPDGISQEDNFFVRENQNTRGRKYVGVMANGKTQVTAEVRLLSAMLQSIKTLRLSQDEEELYWTVVSYFNSMRELGKASSLLRDDVHDQIEKISKREMNNPRVLLQNNAVELTSRVKSGEIPNTLDKLSISHAEREDHAVDTLIATNMFSVGVDVGRLNNMLVVGQPKLTSEYIQATSRVGRENLGMVFTLYNSMRSRDRSHYETFTSYHESLYRYVEPTSVTPFSVPAMKKAIAAVIVSMVRNTVPEMRNENQAGLILQHQQELSQICDFLFDRIKEVDSENHLYFNDARKEINNFLQQWIDMAEENEELFYYKGSDEYAQTLLTSFDQRANGLAIPVMGSMRNVDKQSRFIF
ncbi:helicase domain protein [Ligilactobacillus salitolerans]|uniref:Helicase domain protein n=1 Tax=Ligilactobacillus salitolerans TaxID=1808352 RepID=A0A401IRM7_9LACO|nr:helicase-related protein [Ligilactobacillus salitolerans]GBG94176.1 helicase domain protein [Ligilactobacillus salitolerans]